MVHVLLAPDKFKGTLTAAQVADHLATGLRSVRPDVEIVVLPVSDGGDGLIEVAIGSGFEVVPVRAAGPTGVVGDTSYARRGAEAVVEMATVCGLVRLPDGVPAPAAASSRGVGDVLAAALDAGCTRILLGVGGSASTDGGAGMLAALGARSLDASGAEITDGGGALSKVVHLDLTRLHPGLVGASITVACDVDNPLCGPAGAAAVYGPQKGADTEMVAALDRSLSVWADVIAAAVGDDRRDDPGAGAAGGVGFSAVAVLGASLRPGSEVVQELTGLGDAVARADLVITGEGSLDSQTLHGKAPVGVALAACAAGVPVLAVAGRCLLDSETLTRAGFSAVYTLTDVADDPGECFTSPGPLLERIGARIAHDDLDRSTGARR